MDYLLKASDVVSKIVWGPVMLFLILGVGLYLTVRTRFFQITHFADMLKNTVGSFHKSRQNKTKGISPFQAVSTALAGTLGTGNIVGVATAIVAGGPGSVFWMWVSAVLGMIIKYSEVLLSVKYRVFEGKSPHGGPMYVMDRGMNSKVMAKCFCLFCVFASFGIGSTVQSNSAAAALYSGLNIPKIVSAVGFFIFSLLVIVGGVKRIGATTEKVVPAMAFLYTFMAIAIIFINFKYIPSAFIQIVKGAFGVRSAVGGVEGYTINSAIRFGLSRGIFSNEAGLGSAPIAHAAADVESAPKQGQWGMFEVFFDTVVMCTVTALVILTTGASAGCSDGSQMTINAFSIRLGGLAGGAIAVSMAFFAFASIIGWAYYGEQSVKYLIGGRFLTVYRIVYSVSAGVGCVCALSTVWRISDALNGLMAIPNMISIAVLSSVVIKETENYCENKNSLNDRR